MHQIITPTTLPNAERNPAPVRKDCMIALLGQRFMGREVYG